MNSEAIARIRIPKRIHPRLFRIIATKCRTGRRGPELYEAESVLVIRTDAIGDLVLTFPLLQAIRYSWPATRITVVTKPAPAQILIGSPLADEVLPWEPLARGQQSILGQMHSLRFARKYLIPKRFDLAVLPRRDIDLDGSRFLAAASGATTVIGFDPRGREHEHAERNERQLLTRVVSSGDAADHELDHSRRLIQALGLQEGNVRSGKIGRASLTPQDLVEADRLLHTFVGLNYPLIAVVLGAGDPKRQWPTRRYAAVINAATFRRELKVVVLGGPQDRDEANVFTCALRPDIPVVDAVGRASLATSLAVLSACDLYLGPDTGTAHMASSVATPCIVVSCHAQTGSKISANAPNRFGPWGNEKSRCLQPAASLDECQEECNSSKAHCITGVTEDAVLRALLAALPQKKEISFK